MLSKVIVFIFTALFAGDAHFETEHLEVHILRFFNRPSRIIFARKVLEFRKKKTNIKCLTIHFGFGTRKSIIKEAFHQTG